MIYTTTDGPHGLPSVGYNAWSFWGGSKPREDTVIDSDILRVNLESAKTDRPLIFETEPFGYPESRMTGYERASRAEINHAVWRHYLADDSSRRCGVFDQLTGNGLAEFHPDHPMHTRRLIDYRSSPTIGNMSAQPFYYNGNRLGKIMKSGGFDYLGQLIDGAVAMRGAVYEHVMIVLAVTFLKSFTGIEPDEDLSPYEIPANITKFAIERVQSAGADVLIWHPSKFALPPRTSDLLFSLPNRTTRRSNHDHIPE